MQYIIYWVYKLLEIYEHLLMFYSENKTQKTDRQLIMLQQQLFITVILLIKIKGVWKDKSI